LALDAQDFDTVMTVTALACTGEVRGRVSQAAHSKLFKKIFLELFVYYKLSDSLSADNFALQL